MVKNVVKNISKNYNEYAKKNGCKTNGMDMNELLKKYLSDWTGGDMKFKGNKIVQMKRMVFQR